MAGNSIGTLFKLTSFGESHGEGLGGIIDGMPSGVAVDLDFVQEELDRRKPGQSAIVTQRKEGDRIEILSGVFEGKTTGTPLAFLIRNENQKSKDYSHIKDTYRPSHADYTYDQKYGIRDYRGGGRSSARETVARVVAGAFAKMYLRQQGINFSAFVCQIGHLKLEKSYQELDLSLTETNNVRCPDLDLAAEMESYVKDVRKEGNTVGGAIQCVIQGLPTGLGEPVFDKLHADLGKAMLSINAVKGFEYGSGFEAISMKGSEHNDAFNTDFSTQSNYSGGIQGGISNGEDIYFKVAFKPVATLMQKQTTVNAKGEAVEMEGKGRHDPCVVPRAVVIVEAMAALTIMDHYLRAKSYQ
ncbi:chorismate synthase [Lishizhenia tianjinensis]|uniref:Chorismate synthase n=1 Tax=Lishizhenia tianjinensis TaxID=477690 RepID=A0A1I6YWM1_9FLAO|nr:chorismate synthase [Lishizhenia tianjinensis]SFT54621.1 chorismate synthase [Lishizhenia tianjinensis]